MSLISCFFLPAVMISFHGPPYSLLPAPTGTSSSFPFLFFFFLVEGRSLSRKKHSCFLSVRRTGYVLARREQPSCVDMQTGGCWVDIAFSPLAFSQMPALIKVQMSLFGNFSAYCRVVGAVLLYSDIPRAVLLGSEAQMLGAVKVRCLAEWVWSALCAFGRDNKKYLLLRGGQQWQSRWSMATEICLCSGDQ